MKFDLEHLKDMESRAERLEAEVKELESRKAALQIDEQRASEKERYRQLLDEKKEYKQRRKAEKRKLREIKRDQRSRIAPENSFFAKDEMGRNGIHKIGGFTWKAFFGFSIGTVVSMFFVWPFYMESPHFPTIQLITRSVTCIIAVLVGATGWQGETKLKVENQFFVGIAAIVTLSLVVLGYLGGHDVEGNIHSALTPEAWEDDAESE